MSSARRIVTDLNALVDKQVTVKLVSGRSYTGVLSSFDSGSLMLSLTEARDDQNNYYSRVIINGTVVSEVLVKSSPTFDVREFADMLEKNLSLRPGDIKVYEGAQVVTVMDKIKVSEAGVEGNGPLAQRISDVFKDYMNKKQGGSQGSRK
ncbi:Sm ribonucleoprotein [Sulfodiicoccus acidiphilus]|uniref:Sm ribonucleo n=1 Tax=Sulfodiicoccus acidiphilus TaxID=1670455 RepID=A0A348B1C8_9CREN|nr:Lsm family RNA-binding protein [Sulfodiicoccus acidiphilus]BBD71980.1 Sm ribonucleoprotein [Sulfodiicoccus acidiphilus]GGT91902.1 Sm ribonucleo [Sulfodiicoccus acidiphilus]